MKGGVTLAGRNCAKAQSAARATPPWDATVTPLRTSWAVKKPIRAASRDDVGQANAAKARPELCVMRGGGEIDEPTNHGRTLRGVG